ncbi:hypothetical protein [Petropleomorpha daqingensis]|uniref:Uncharacterized protein n=1 Tax=Petropleomorpha daqingensis TaxID=2026353 RepID=A0A853CPE0_9ACTN|nr:hypothetical protein [Petropleomorpha daqingensis]NYJ08078.1 hypothetical protein [Petropleomorpha daqingensis]
MADVDPRRRTDPGELAEFHVAAQRRREEQESAKAQVLVDRFVAQATERGLATEELTARPWSGRGRYRTGVVGWYLRRDLSVGVGRDGSYYQLVVPQSRFGRWRTVALKPTPPPLQVGKGARDGESVPLAELLDARLRWS